MTIYKLAKTVRDCLREGIAWVVVYKCNGEWLYQAAWPNGGSYDDGYEFSDDDVSLMRIAESYDHKAIAINGYYTNCGVEEDVYPTIKDIQLGIEWNYYGRHNQLSSFLDGWVLPN